MAKKKRTNAPTKEKLNTLIHFLLDKPTASKAEQATLLDMGIDNLERTYHSALYEEVKEDDSETTTSLAVENPVFTEKIRRHRERFWIFIQTFYDKDYDRGCDKYHLPLLKDPVKEGEEHLFQQWVIKYLREQLHTYADNDLLPGGATVLLGAPFDIMFIVDCKCEKTELVYDFVIKHVRTCPHVQSTTTAWSLPEGNRPWHAG